MSVGDWLGWGAKKIINAAVPGLGTVIDFAMAALDLANGNFSGALFNVVAGVEKIATCGASKGVVKEMIEKISKDEELLKAILTEILDNQIKEFV